MCPVKTFTDKLFCVSSFFMNIIMPASQTETIPYFMNILTMKLYDVLAFGVPVMLLRRNLPACLFIYL